MVYDGINQQVLMYVPKTAKHMLDVGCGSGAMGRRIKEEIACRVVGITHSTAEAALATQFLDQVIVGDLNHFDALEISEFDCIICSHVLEHLHQPDRLLKQLRRNLSPGGILIAAVPNVLYWSQRLKFLFGEFRYTDGGLMDRTHYRFFDWSTAKELFTSSGYTIIESEACGGFPLSRFLLRLGGWMDRAALKSFPGLFGFQFVFICGSDSSSE